MSITLEQVKKWSEPLKNGFKLDIGALQLRNEKNAIKAIPLEDGVYLRAVIWWNEVSTGYRPQIHLSVWKKTNSGMWRSRGLGSVVNLTDQVFPRRIWSKIAELTEDWSDERVLDLAREHIDELNKETVF